MDIGKEQNNRWLHPCCFESKTATLILRTVYAIVVLLTLAIGWATVRNSDDLPLTKVGFITALIGFSIIAVQVMLGSRLKLLDRAFGLDKVVIFHRKMGVVAAVLLLSHPLLMALGKKSFKLFYFHTSWQVNLGKGGLLLLVAGVLLALFYSKFRLDYNVWRLIHKTMIVVVILAFAHSILIGDAFKIGWIKAWWWALLVFACATFFWQNFVVILFGRKKYIVKSVTKETHDTFTLRFEPAGSPGTPVLDYKPGQFMFLELQHRGRMSEEHPFTISSSPTAQGHITATIKKSGNYTNLIDQTQVSDAAFLQAPFGRFSWAFDNPSSFLFIVGGVGITPIHSMITALCDIGDKRNAVLIYANKTEQDIIFRTQFDNLPVNFKVVYVLSKPGQNWQGFGGHINTEIIKNSAGGLLDSADVYLCGPPMMMQSVVNALESLGVDKRKIHYERFTI
jgi:predicted ferric reductase